MISSPGITVATAKISVAFIRYGIAPNCSEEYRAFRRLAAALLLVLNSRAGTDGGWDGLSGDGLAGGDWSDDHAQVYQATGMVSAQRCPALVC